MVTGKKVILPAIQKQLGMLAKIRRNISWKQLIDSLILSKLTYLICIWGNTMENQTRRAQVCLNSAARYVTGDRRPVSKNKLMKNCGWLDVSKLTEYYSLIQIWKAARWGIPYYLKENIDEEENGILMSDKTRLLLTADAFRAKTIVRWNNLPMELRTELRIKHFKQNLRSWIIDRRTTLLELEMEPD